MNNILDIKSPAQKEALVQKAFLGLDLIGLTNLHQAYWNLPDRGALRRDRLPPRSADFHQRPDHRQHRQAHRALGQRQVRGQGRHHRRARLVGRIQPPVQSRQVQRSLRPPDGFPAGPRRVRAGLLRRRRSELPPARARHHRTCVAQPLRAHHADSLCHARRIPALRARLHRHFRAVFQGHAVHRHDSRRDVHSAQLRAEGLHHRQHGLRRRNQEIRVHDHELPYAACRA